MKPSPNIVLLTGWGQDKAVFEALFRELSLGSLGGHIEIVEISSLSPCALPSLEKQEKEPLSFYAQEIKKRLQEKRGGLNIVLGHSLGGMVALELAASSPENLSGLIMLGSTSRFLLTEGYLFGTREKKLQGLIERLEEDADSALRRFFSFSAMPYVLSSEELDAQVKVALGFGEKSLLFGLEYLRSFDLRGSLPQICVPSLLIHGSEDSVIPVGASQYLHKHLPGSNFLLVEGGGHALAERELGSITQPTKNFIHGIAQT